VMSLRGTYYMHVAHKTMIRTPNPNPDAGKIRKENQYLYCVCPRNFVCRLKIRPTIPTTLPSGSSPRLSATRATLSRASYRTASAVALRQAVHYNGPRVGYTRGVMTFDVLPEGDGCQPGAHARNTALLAVWLLHNTGLKGEKQRRV
jgi:hypothetical protein